jgi:outer membrane protein OmpA-like peptidoglycan-associated protein
MSVLTPNGKKIVDFAASQIKPSSRVTVTGYCDTSETNPDKLSLARAVAIANALAAGGVPIGVPITLIGKGASELRKPTGPKVAEPLNRYVSIALE